MQDRASGISKSRDLLTGYAVTCQKKSQKWRNRGKYNQIIFADQRAAGYDLVVLPRPDLH